MIKFYFYYFYYLACYHLSNIFDYIFATQGRKLSFYFAGIIWIIGFIIELSIVQSKTEVIFHGKGCDDYQIKKIPVKLTKRLFMKAVCWPVSFAWLAFWCLMDIIMGIIGPVLYIPTPWMWQNSKFKAFLSKRVIG